MTTTIHPLKNNRFLNRAVQIPSSKSHMVRALLIGSLANGTSLLRNPLQSADTLSCAEACRALGADITIEKNLWTVKGLGGVMPETETTIDVGNSGTSLYLLTAVASLGKVKVHFDGDEQIRQRSALNLLLALEDLGVRVEYRENGCAPYHVQGPFSGGSTAIDCPTSQYLSALLLAAPLAHCESTEISVPLLFEQPYVTMTLDWLSSQGVHLTYSDDFASFRIPGGQKYTPFDRQIPTDFSSATFFLCLAAICGEELFFPGLDFSDSQGDKQVLEYLTAMGCTWEERENGILFCGRTLKGAELDLNATPDALPAMAVTACFADGQTVLGNVPQARMKETDRIAVMTKELKKMGADISELDDGLVINGGPLKGSALCGHGDHRIIMALSIAALFADGESVIDDSSAVNVTFPNFYDLLSGVVDISESAIG